MTPGRPSHPRLRLNPELRRTARAAMLTGMRSAAMALVCGYPNPSSLSSILHARRISTTPLTVSRLERLAGLLKFPPDRIFLSEPEAEVEASGAFTTIPAPEVEP